MPPALDHAITAPFGIGDGDRRVVERGVDVRVSVVDDALLAALLERLLLRGRPAGFLAASGVAGVDGSSLHISCSYSCSASQLAATAG
jgi:hypothetical protein